MPRKRSKKLKEAKDEAKTLPVEIVEPSLWDMQRKAMIASVGGRPTKYRREFARSLIEYFMQAPPYVIFNTMFGPKDVPSDLPTIEGFALCIGVHKDTLYEWEKKTDEKGQLVHPEFSDAMKKARTVQAHFLVTNALRKNYEKTFAIFFGKNNLGMRDEQHVTHDVMTYQQIEQEKARSVEEARRLAEAD